MKIDALVELSDEGLVNDFVFEIGGEEYECSRRVACLVSKKVAKLVEIEPALAKFVIDLRDDFRQFQLMEKLMKGESVEVNEQESMFLLLVALKLENQQLIDQLDQIILDESKITLSNVCHRLEQKEALGLNMQPEIRFAATRFSELNPTTAKLLSLPILNEIISHPDLSLESSQLREFIESLIHEKGSEYSILMPLLLDDYKPSSVSHASEPPTMLGSDLFADEDPVFAPPLTRWQLPVNCFDPPQNPALNKKKKEELPSRSMKRTPMIKNSESFSTTTKTMTESTVLPVFFDA